MILEEFFNIVWFLRTKRPENDSGTAEAQPLSDNTGEDGRNRESMGNSGGIVQDNRRSESEQTSGTNSSESEGRYMTYFKTYVASCKTNWPSLFASIKVNVVGILVAIPVAAVAGCLLYLDFETTDKCLAIMQFYRSILARTMRWELVGTSIQAIFINLWFVATMALFLGRAYIQVMKHLIIVGFAAAAIQIILNAYLIVFDVYDRSCNEVFLLGLCLSSYVFGKAVNDGTTTTAQSKWRSIKAAACIWGHFVVMFFIALCHRFAVIPLFNGAKKLTSKALIALISPILAYLATSISQYIMLACFITKEDPIPKGPTPVDLTQEGPTPVDLTQEGPTPNRNRMYVLVYFNHLLPLALFRVMQADFDEWALFIGLSLAYGGTTIFSGATREFRKKIWNDLTKFLSQRWSCLKDRPKALFDHPESERLHVDMEIQNFLYHNVMIVLSQLYITLYRYSTFDVPHAEEFPRMIWRVLVGLGFEIFFNIVTVLLQIRLDDSKIEKVWFNWTNFGYHVAANVVVVVITICYFSQVLFSVLQVPIGNSLEGHRVRNCSTPFTYQ